MTSFVKPIPIRGSNGNYTLTPPSSEAGDKSPKKTSFGNSPLSPPQTPARSITVESIATTSEYPQIINGVLQSKYRNSKELCRSFMKPKGGCRNSRCRFTHDYHARGRHLADLDRLTSQKRTAMVGLLYQRPAAEVMYDRNARILADIATTEVNNIALPSTSLSISVASLNSSLSRTFSSTTDTPPIPPGKSHWNGESNNALWAKSNVRDETHLKLLAPYLGLHSIPAKIVTAIRNQSKSNARDVFHFFPCLPGELRNKIFNYAIDDEISKGARGIRLQYYCDRYIGGEPIGGKLICKTPSPALLSVCRESQSLMADHYQRTAFNPTTHPDDYTFVNFDKDQLFLHANGAMQLHRMVDIMGEELCARVKSLIIPLKEWLGDRSRETDYMGPILAHFTNLESLKLMVGDGHMDLPFHRSKYCANAKSVLYRYLKLKYRDYDPKDLPKVSLVVIPAIRAHDFGIDELIYMGEGGFGTGGNGW